VNGFLVVYLDSIGERLLEYLHQDDEVHGPLSPSQGNRGSCTFCQISIDSGQSTLERLLEMVTSACAAGSSDRLQLSGRVAACQIAASGFGRQDLAFRKPIW
jgi:ferredoxin